VIVLPEKGLAILAVIEIALDKLVWEFLFTVD
jgi:hypothetical protein